VKLVRFRNTYRVFDGREKVALFLRKLNLRVCFWPSAVFSKECLDAVFHRQSKFELRVPDGNGVELYWDRPQEEWPLTNDGELVMVTRPLDLRGLLLAA